MAKLMTQAQVEQRLGLGKRALSRLRKLGEPTPPRVRVGGRHFYRWEDVEAWLDGQRENGEAV